MSQNILYSRRLFLTRGAQLLSAAGTLPLFLDRAGQCMAADAAANPQGAGRPDRVLVVVQLAGGNDGLNTIIPYRNDDYYRVRPRLGIPKDTALKATDDFAFHPKCEGFKKLYDAGLMGVLHAVGYPNHNRSHFRSTDIWMTADPEKAGTAGWLGRYFDNCCPGQDPGPQAEKLKQAEPSAAIALTGEPPIALQGRKFLPIAFRSPASLAYTEASRDMKIKGAFEQLNDVDHQMDEKGVPTIPLGTNGSLNLPSAETNIFLQRSALNARVYADTIRKSVASVSNKANYPQTGLAQDLKLVAQMIAAGLPTRVYYVQLGGFDTHSNELVRHARLMEELSGAMASFLDDLQQLGHLDRTAVMTFSEFGRRVAENGSAGTDHGEAAPLFVFGGPIKPGFHGTPADLRPANLHRGDVPFQLDFRRVYATMLGSWLKADDATVLGGKFEKLDLFKNA
jgi:uncharacterized protein (DUF1501 family)